MAIKTRNYENFLYEFDTFAAGNSVIVPYSRSKGTLIVTPEYAVEAATRVYELLEKTQSDGISVHVSGGAGFSDYGWLLNFAPFIKRIHLEEGVTPPVSLLEKCDKLEYMSLKSGIIGLSFSSFPRLKEAVVFGGLNELFLQACGELGKLTLWRVDIKKEGWHWLSNIKKLKHLDLRLPKAMSFFDVPESNIEIMEISNARGLTTLAGIGRFKRLSSLNIFGGGSLTDMASFENLPECLEYLVITSKSVRVPVDTLQRYKHLKVAWVNGKKHTFG